MAAHSSVLAWRVPWTEEPGGLPSIGLQRVGQTKHIQQPHAEALWQFQGSVSRSAVPDSLRPHEL